MSRSLFRHVKASHPGAANRLGNPLDLIEAAHQFQASLCDILETIADSLPDDVDRRLAMTAADTLNIDLPIHHRDEEEGLFPLLRKRIEASDKLIEVMAQLAQEHHADESSAEELNEILAAMARGDRVDNPEMAGYMLRGFFEGYRRHLNWENTLLLPTARKILTSDDLDELSKVLAANRRSSPPVRDTHT